MERTPADPRLLPLLQGLVADANAGAADAELFGRMCAAVATAGVPLARAALQMENLHPVYYGYCLHWEADGPARILERSREFGASEEFRLSPYMAALRQGGWRWRAGDGDPRPAPGARARRLRRHRLHGRDRRRDRDAAARDHLGDAVARRVRREGRRLPARARPAAGPGVRIGCGAPQARCRSAHLSRRRAGPRGAGGADPARRCPPARRRGAAHRPARLHRPDRLRARDRASGHTGPLLRGRRRHGPCRGRRGAQVHRRRRAVGVPGRAGVGRRGRRARHSRRMGHRSPRCSP